MKYVYGPVPSRRLGQSLGIDPIPLKTCNWNCVYCQLGRTKPLTNRRDTYISTDEILSEVKATMANQKPGEIDWLTIVGSGEPTLNLGVGELIGEVKSLTDIPVAVITNGSLLYQPEVRHELAVADAVLPSLDAGSEDIYRRINRPHPECTYKRLVDGLIAFRELFTGKFWLEMMLVKGLNDTQAALKDIATVLKRIRPDQVHINMPTRPPAETWVQPSDEEGIMRALAILGEAASVVHPAEGTFDLGDDDNLVDAVVSIITRHPMREEELIRTLGRWSHGEVNEILEDLERSEQAQSVYRHGCRFWSASGSFYPDETQSQATSPNALHQHRSHSGKK